MVFHVEGNNISPCRCSQRRGYYWLEMAKDAAEMQMAVYSQEPLDIRSFYLHRKAEIGGSRIWISFYTIYCLHNHAYSIKIKGNHRGSL